MNYLRSYIFSKSTVAGYTFKPSNFDFNKSNNDWMEFERELCVSKNSILLPVQRHTDVIVFDDIPNSPSDGIFISKKRFGVGVLTADCIPFLIEMGDVAVGAIHAGWRGLLRDIVFKGITLACEYYKVYPQDVKVSIGPGADVCCYSIKADVAQLWRNKGVEVKVYDGVMKLDLYRIAMSQVRMAGVENIELIRACSICSGIFHTKRGGDEGRNLAFIIKI